VAKLPIVSGKVLVKLFTSELGYYVRDQRGSHVHLRHPSRLPLTIPMHATIARGTLGAILKQAGIDRNEFLRLIER
jgi:predicted RNA binding protein YcfA (HicA-like mRNA interferase family)